MENSCINSKTKLRNILISPFLDTRHRTITGKLFPGLDAIRGLAALTVLASHSGVPFFAGQGGNGVMLFFVLSSFLLTTQLIRFPLAPSWRVYRDFLIKRFFRIYPLFVFTVVLFYFVGSIEDESVFLHIFFMRGDGHFWSVAPECFYYVLLPLISLVYYWTGSNLKYAFMLFVLSVVDRICDFKVLPSNSLVLVLYTFSFLIGSVAALVFKEYKTTKISQNVLIVTCVLCLFSIPLTSRFLTKDLLQLGNYCAWEYPYWSSVVAAVVVICASKIEGAFIDYLFLLRHVGILSFGIYLLHPLALGFMVSNIEPGLIQFFCALFVSYFMAYIAYICIEKPFIALGRALISRLAAC